MMISLLFYKLENILTYTLPTVKPVQTTRSSTAGCNISFKVRFYEIHQKHQKVVHFPLFPVQNLTFIIAVYGIHRIVPNKQERKIEYRRYGKWKRSERSYCYSQGRQKRKSHFRFSSYKCICSCRKSLDFPLIPRTAFRFTKQIM